MTHVNNAKIKLRRMHLKEDAASELRAAEADAAARPSAATREALSAAWARAASQGVSLTHLRHARRTMEALTLTLTLPLTLTLTLTLTLRQACEAYDGGTRV